MATLSADELRRACEAAVDGGGRKQKVVLSIYITKSRGARGKVGEFVCNVGKPRVLAITVKQKGQRTKAFLQVLKYSFGEILEPEKVLKLKHLSNVEVTQNDPSGCTFMLGFNNLRNQSVAPPQWTARNKDDRNRALMCIFNMSKELLGCLPKVVGMDIVEMALWAKENTSSVTNKVNAENGQSVSLMSQTNSEVTLEIDLISQAEMEETEALLGIYVMGIGETEAFSEGFKQELLALEAANLHAFFESEPVIEEALQRLESTVMYVEDIDEWLGIFIVKLRHMIEDIESIEFRNNKLELQSVSDKLLMKELDKLLERFQIPDEFEACLTKGSFNEANMAKNIEACEWLICALKNVEASDLDASYVKMRAVKDKLDELVLIKHTFVRRASEFLRNYFPSLVDCMLHDKNHFSQRGQLKRPDHSDFRYKCRIYARLVQHIKSLDTNCLGPLRKVYCQSLNLLLRREAREFANELRHGVKVPKVSIVWHEGPLSSTADSSSVPESYSKMLTVFIPLLVDESSFFTHFMCFDVTAPSQLEDAAASDKADSVNNCPNGSSQIKHAHQGADFSESGVLNECLKDLLDGMQEDFSSLVDWAYKIDPLFCISMHGITKCYLSGNKCDTASFVHMLLDGLERRISLQFNKFIDDVCHQIGRSEHNVRQMRVLPDISRFVVLANRMEQYIQGQARDLIDHAYAKLVSITFVTLERTAQIDPTYADIVLLQNYAAFLNSIYDLAKLVPTLAKFYCQASESYEQACLRHINMVIYINFEKLFLFARKIKDMMVAMSPEEIPFQVGMSKMELQKTLKTSLSEIDKTFNAMYRKFQNDITAEELLVPLWDKCKIEFLRKYRNFVEDVAKIYPSEKVPSVEEMKDVLTSM